MYKLRVLFVIITVIRQGSTQCNSPLGFEDGNITDSQFSASGTWTSSYLPENARLNVGNGWAGSPSNDKQYLQIDLLTIHEVTSVSTQGITNGWFTKTYRILYSNDGIQWHSYNSARSRDPRGEILTANINYGGIKTNDLVPSIKARYIAINPLTYTGYPCLRLELNGCPVSESIVQRKTDVTMNIEEDQVWIPSQSPYVIDREINIRPTATLTIQAGVNVIFTNTNGSLVVHGNLKVLGLSGLQTLFSSSKPTAVMLWKGITVLSGGFLSMSFSHMRNAESAITVYQLDDLELNSSVIYSCKKGVQIKSGSVNRTRSAISDVEFTWNEIGILCHGSTSAPYINIRRCLFTNLKNTGVSVSSWDHTRNTRTELVIRHSIFNQSEYGINIYVIPGSVEIENCTFTRQTTQSFKFSDDYYGQDFIFNMSKSLIEKSLRSIPAISILMACRNKQISMINNIFRENRAQDVYLRCTREEDGMWYFDFSNNTLENNRYQYGSIHIDQRVPVRARLLHNTFSDMFMAASVSASKIKQTSSFIVINNKFVGITGRSVFEVKKIKVEFNNNTLENCSSENGLVVSKFLDHEIHYNKFLNVSGSYSVVLGFSSDNDNSSIYRINISRNYWGYNDPNLIRLHILDIFSSVKRGYGIIVPYYTSDQLEQVSNVDVTQWFSNENGSIGGELASSVTLQGNRNYIADKTIIIPANMTLNIESNAMIDFSKDIGILVQGRLIVNGTSVSSVILRQSIIVNDNARWAGLILENGEIYSEYLSISNASSCASFSGEKTKILIQFAKFHFCQTAIKGTLSNNMTLLMNNSFIHNNNQGLDLSTRRGSFASVVLFNSSFIDNENNAIQIGHEIYGQQAENISVIAEYCLFTSSIFISNCNPGVFISIKKSRFEMTKRYYPNAVSSYAGYMNVHIQDTEFGEETGRLFLRFCKSDSHTGSVLDRQINITRNTFNRTRDIRAIDIDYGYTYRPLEHKINISDNTFTSLTRPSLRYHIIRLNFQYTDHLLVIKNNIFRMDKLTNTYAIYIYRRISSLYFENNQFFNGSQAIFLHVASNPKAVGLISNNTFDSFTGVDARSNDEVIHLNYVSDTPLLVKNNQFRYNNGTVIRLLTPDVKIYGNAFENPTADYNVKFDSTQFRSQVVNASFNYWGSADIKQISQKIYDKAYNSDLAEIQYLPFLGSWNISDVQETTSSFVGDESQIGGAVNGNITLSRDGSPYTVVSNIEIKYTDVLIIEAGVKIYFPENIGITVVGSLRILGNSTHKVEMLSEKTGSKWRGIEFKPEYDNSGMVDVRLVNGKTPNEGRVELYYNGQWGTVCDDGFGYADARVVCRMLGYDPDVGVSYYNYGHFGEGTGIIWLRYVACKGDEEHIKHCTSNGWGNVASCSHKEDAGVKCDGEHRISKRQADGNIMTDQPRNLTARHAMEDITSIILEWTSPLNLTNNLTGYRIKIQKQDSEVVSQIDILPNITIYTLQSLEPNTLYYITIQAKYTEYISGNSDALMFRTAKGPTPYSILRHLTVNDTLNGVLLRGNIQEVRSLHSFYSKNSGLTIDFNDLTPVKYIDAYDVISRSNGIHGLMVEANKLRQETELFLTNSSFYSNNGNGIEVNGNVNLSIHQCVLFQNTRAIDIGETITGSVKVYNSNFFQNSQQVLFVRSSGIYSMEHYDVVIKGCNVRDHNTRYYSSWRWQIKPLFDIHPYRLPKFSAKITDNRIFDNVADGFYFYYTGNQAHNTDISNNIFTNNSYFVRLQTTATYNLRISNVTINKNTVMNCRDKAHALMWFRIGQANLEIKNGTFFNNTHSSIIETGEFGSSEIIVSGNDMRNNTVQNTVESTMVHNVTVHHNILHNNATCELHVTEYADWLVVNALYNYYGYKDLKDVIDRVCGFDKDMGKIRINYIPFLEELEFFPSFNAYISPGSHSTFFNGDVIGGDIETSVTLSTRMKPYDIDRSIYIRPGAKLVIEKGVTVRFKANRGIYVRGALVTNGDHENNVNLLPFNNSPWYGVILDSYNSFNFYGMYDSAPLATLIWFSSTKSVHMVFEDQDSVTINCYAYSSQQLQFKWEKRTDNIVNELTDTERYEIIPRVGLKIRNPRRDLDVGSYRCSPYSEDVYVVGKWISLEFAFSGEFTNAQPAPVTAMKYDGVMIRCPQISLSHPEVYTFVWKKDSVFIQHGLNNVFMSRDGNLYISEVSQADAGQYVCVLTRNDDTRTESFDVPNSGSANGTTLPKSSLPITLSVTDAVSTTKPPTVQFNKMTPNVPLYEQDTVILECLAFGSGPLEYIWTVPSGATSRRIIDEMPSSYIPWDYEHHWLSNNNRVLRISYARLDDSGVYNCTVNSGELSDSMTHEVTIQEKLKIVTSFNSRKAQPNSNTTWVCNATGLGTLQYKWYHNGKLLNTSTENGIAINSNILTITKLNHLRHNGIYQCLVSNGIEEVSTHGLLTVLVYGPLITGIRLVDKNSSRSGRVEIQHAGVYGRVVFRSLTTETARVVCRMLGFDVAKPGLDVQTFSASIPYDLKKVRPIWIENPICPSNTISLEQCSADRKWGKIGDYGYRDFGVTCLGEYIGGHIESDTIFSSVILNNTREGIDVRSNIVKFSDTIVNNTIETGMTVSFGVGLLDMNGTKIINSGNIGMKFSTVHYVGVKNVTIINSVEAVKISGAQGDIDVTNVVIRNCSEGISVTPQATAEKNYTFSNNIITNSTSKALQINVGGSYQGRIYLLHNLFEDNPSIAVKIVASVYRYAPIKPGEGDYVVLKSNRFINSAKIYIDLYNRYDLLFTENEILNGHGDQNCLLEVRPRGNNNVIGRNITISANSFSNVIGTCVVNLASSAYKFRGLFQYNRLFDNNVPGSVIVLDSEFFNLTYNRFYNPKSTYDLGVFRKGNSVVNGTYNWWGSADLNFALLRVFDKRRQTDLLKVNIQPILTEEEFDCSDVNNCSGRGECVKPNGCRCNSGWAGKECTDFNCAGVNSCYGNGVCIGPNTCSCNTGWAGSYCTLATCLNVNNCTNHGICVFPDHCLCIQKYAGDDCSRCSADRWGKSCEPCPKCVNGLCDKDNGRCVCDNIRWAGDLCDRCNQTFYGPECLPFVNILSIEPTTGVDNGNTPIHVRGHNFPQTANNTYFCRFGSVTVPGTWISRDHVVCRSPKQSEGIVFLEISSDGISFTNNKTVFTYYATCPPSACGRDRNPPHGQCLYGNCVCIKPYFGQDCGRELLKPVIGQHIKQSLNIKEGYYWSMDLQLTQGSKPLQWKSSNGPPGFQIDQETGRLEWGPTIASPEPYNVVITVSNSIGQDATTIQLQADYSYNVTVTDIQPSATLAFPVAVRIYGHINILNQSTWNERLVSVDVKIRNKNKTKTQFVYTNPINKGFFETTYYPRPDDSGRFSVDARHPADTGFQEQDYWTVIGMKTSPSYVYKTAYLDTNTVVFKNIGKLVNTGVDMITDINVKVEGIGGPLSNATVNFTGQPNQNKLASLGPNQESIFDLSLNATGPLHGTIAIVFTSTGGTSTIMRVRLSLNIRKPVLQLDPQSWSGSVVRGTQKNFEMKITNLGEVAATDVKLALSNDKRLSVVSFSVLGIATTSDNMTIDPNKTAVLSVTVTPTKDEPLGEMRGRIGLNTKTTAKYINYHFFITSIQVMNFSVRVEDEYTYFAPGKPLLAGATVKLSNPRRHYSRELITNNDTEVTFDDIYEDRYNLHVSAPSHSSYTAVIITEFDKNNITVFLERIAVTYTWTVTPTTIQDKYVITMESTFETQVPMPVVTIEPAKVNTIPYEEGRLDRMEFVVTNHGLIRADNLRFSLPSHPYLIFTQTIPNIGSLAANSSMVIPLSVELKSRKRRNAAAAAFCGLMLLYDFDCGGPRTKGLDVTMTRETPGRPPMPCGLTSSGVSSRRGPYTGVSGTGGTSATGTGSSVSYNPVTPMSCDCAKTLIQTCALSFHPIVGCAYATVDLALSDSFFGFLSNALNFAFSCVIGVFCTLCGYAWTIANCIYEASETCASGSRRRRDVSSALIDQMFEAARPMNNYLSILTEVFGDDRMHNIDEYEWYQKFKSMISDNSEEGVILTNSEVMQVIATINKTTNKEIIQKFLHRWNNTASALNNGTLGSADTSKNLMSKAVLDPKFEKLVSDTEASKKKGYDSIFDFFDHSLNAYKANEKQQSKEDDGVCAKVRVRIVQELVLTRDAFNAKLEIENGEESDLEDIKVTIEIRQTYGSGEPAIQHFSIGDPALVGITGVDGTGRLRRSVSGTAEWLIVPYSTAAMKDDTLYDVGGRLTYRVGGSNFSLSLLPDTITVKPNPSLIVHYFHEKYVQGDDPMTQNVVEPIVPFSLSVMVANTGYGVARAMKITSAQPEIIENEKGLLVSFKIVGAQLGKEPITPSLTVTFGDIDPFETKNARWLLTSTLKGTFYNYSATFENINPLGDPQLSLLDELGYHELLHLVRIEGDADDGLDDYLVNDIIDETDMPDRLYDSSNGTINYNVTVTNATSFRHHSFEQRGSKNYTFIRLETKVREEGWFYLRVINNITKSPMMSGPKLLSVVNLRANGDHTNILVGKNAWITTHINDEYFFHLLDKNQNKSVNMSYELIFGPVNMYAPRFEKDIYNVYTYITIEIGSVILTVNASDIDRDNITYAVQDEAGYFHLDSVKGTLTLAKVFSTVTKMKFNITAVDNGIPSKSTNVSVIVNVVSSNYSMTLTTTTLVTTKTTSLSTPSDKTETSSTSTTSTSPIPHATNATIAYTDTSSYSMSPSTVTKDHLSTSSSTATRGHSSTSPSTATQDQSSTSPSLVTQGVSSTVSTSAGNITSTMQTASSTQTDSSTSSTKTSTDFNITEAVKTTQTTITTGKVRTSVSYSTGKPGDTDSTNQSQLNVWRILFIIAVVILIVVLAAVLSVWLYRRRHGFGDNRYRLELVGM